MVHTGAHPSARRHLLRSVGMALVVALGLAVPAMANAAARSHARAHAGAQSTSCPWVGSSAPISQRVDQVINSMTLADEITIVQGAGTTNPYVF
jgi:beta-glucosidase